MEMGLGARRQRRKPVNMFPKHAKQMGFLPVDKRDTKVMPALEVTVVPTLLPPALPPALSVQGCAPARASRLPSCGCYVLCVCCQVAEC